LRGRKTYEVKEHVTGVLRIPVTVRYARLKRLRITLDDTGHVIAHAPNRMPLKDIDHFIEQNADWIEKHRLKLLNKIDLP
jgi:predicted metal-dependent hydrolase